jgi:hypothetical protein
MSSAGGRKRAEPFADTPTSQLGNENRISILPKGETDLKYTEPSYDYAAAIPMPSDIGVGTGDSLDSVFKAVKGMAFYTDTIGFGGSSSALTSGMPLNPHGINYFMPTYQRCPNGARMWTYIEGIPKGDVLGETLKVAFEKQGFPALKGLAPGSLEDAKTALNPMPYVNAIIGNPYPDCEIKTERVGDALGRTSDPNDVKNVWISGPFDVQNGIPVQSKWVQRKDAKGNYVYIDRKAALCTRKTLNEDGSPNPAPPELDSSCSNKEGFSTQDTVSLAVSAVLLVIAVIIKSYR